MPWLREDSVHLGLAASQSDQRSEVRYFRHEGCGQRQGHRAIKGQASSGKGEEFANPGPKDLGGRTWIGGGALGAAHKAWFARPGSVQAAGKQPALSAGAAASEELLTTGMSYVTPEKRLPDRKCHRVFNRRCYSMHTVEAVFQNIVLQLTVGTHDCTNTT